jgi:hypothetical protein
MQSGMLCRQRCSALGFNRNPKYIRSACQPATARRAAQFRPAAATESAAAATVAEAPASPDGIFQGLCSASGIESGAVKIQRISKDKGTGLFAARDIAKGDTVLRWV